MDKPNGFNKLPLEPRLLKKKKGKPAPFQIKMRVTFKQESNFWSLFYIAQENLSWLFFQSNWLLLWYPLETGIMSSGCSRAAVWWSSSRAPDQLHHWFSGRRGGGRLFNNRNQKYRSVVRISFACCTEWNMYVYSNSTGSDELWNTEVFIMTVQAVWMWRGVG